MSECFSKNYSTIVEMFYEVYHLDKCIKNPEHSVSLVCTHPKIFFCKICNDCYGLDDSSPLDLLNIIEDCSYLCVEKCARCGNNDPNFMILDINESRSKLTCKNCDEEISLNISKCSLSDDLGNNYSFSNTSNSNTSNFLNGINGQNVETSTSYAGNHLLSTEKNDSTDISNGTDFVPISCFKCNSQTGLAIMGDDGKMNEVICTQCNRSNYFNAAKVKSRSRCMKESKNKSDENDWKKTYLENARNEFNQINNEQTTLPMCSTLKHGHTENKQLISINFSSKRDKTAQNDHEKTGNKPIFNSSYRKKSKGTIMTSQIEGSNGCNENNKHYTAYTSSDYETTNLGYKTVTSDYETMTNNESEISENTNSSNNGKFLMKSMNNSDLNTDVNDFTNETNNINNDTNNTDESTNYPNNETLGTNTISQSYLFNWTKWLYGLFTRDQAGTSIGHNIKNVAWKSTVVIASSNMVICICDFLATYYPCHKGVIDAYKGSLAKFVQGLMYEIIKNKTIVRK